jgi:hypothetical protein
MKRFVVVAVTLLVCTLLAQFDVVVDTLPPHPTALWARF